MKYNKKLNLSLGILLRFQVSLVLSCRDGIIVIEYNFFVWLAKNISSKTVKKPGHLMNFKVVLGPINRNSESYSCSAERL